MGMVAVMGIIILSILIILTGYATGDETQMPLKLISVLIFILFVLLEATNERFLLHYIF